MATEKIRHLVAKKNRDGTRRYYWQPSAALREAGWPSRRLSDERAEAIAEAERLNANLDAWRARGDANAVRRPGTRPVTVADLIADFKRHRWYSDKAPKTRRWYDQNLKVIEAWAGKQPVLAIDRNLVDQLYSTMRARTPARAAAVVTALRRLYEYGKFPFGEGFANPAAKLDISSGRRAPARLWTLEELDHMIATADTQGWPSVGDAIAAAWWLGQRQGDILSLTRADYRDGTFWITQNKTQARVAVPHSPMLARRIEAAIARQREGAIEGTHLICHETTHLPWQEDTFRHQFAEIREKAMAGMESCAGLLFRHLRHTAVTNLHSAGCDAGDIATITGHSLAGINQILDVYFVRTEQTAAKAAKKRLAWERKERAKAEKTNAK